MEKKSTVNEIFAERFFVMKAENKNQLSKTELRIVELLEKGLSNKSISIQYKISENTVKYHLKNIYRKLSVRNRVEAIYKLSKT